MSNVQLPSWADRAKRAGSVAVSVFGLIVLLRYAVLVVRVVFADASWGDRSPMWLQLAGIGTLGIAAALGLVWLAGEFVAGLRTPKS